MYNLVNLEDKTILIAGASSGIGRATALLVSKLGAKVILIARREEKLKEVISQLEGEGHSYYVADLSEIDHIANFVKRIVAEQGPLDGMVYSAGISGDQPMSLASPEKVLHSFTINYFAFYETVRQVTKKGRFNPNMRIVGISSIAVNQGAKAQSLYVATKGAMNASIRNMAHELADKGICINAVAPGMTKTKLYDDYLEKFGGEASNSNQRLLSKQYLGIIEPEDIANSIVFLLSSASKYITGITLLVAGGSF